MTTPISPEDQTEGEVTTTMLCECGHPAHDHDEKGTLCLSCDKCGGFTDYEPDWIGRLQVLAGEARFRTANGGPVGEEFSDTFSPSTVAAMLNVVRAADTFDYDEWGIIGDDQLSATVGALENLVCDE